PRLLPDLIQRTIFGSAISCDEVAALAHDKHGPVRMKREVTRRERRARSRGRGGKHPTVEGEMRNRVGALVGHEDFALLVETDRVSMTARRDRLRRGGGLAVVADGVNVHVPLVVVRS